MEKWIHHVDIDMVDRTIMIMIMLGYVIKCNMKIHMGEVSGDRIPGPNIARCFGEKYSILSYWLT